MDVFSRLTVVGALVLGCAPSLEDSLNDSGSGGSTVSDGSAVIDATDAEAWVYFDFEAGAVVSPENPEDDTTWDVGFRRSDPMVNGGVSGTGGVEASELLGASFDELSVAPDGGYDTDEESSGDGTVEYVLGEWFDYDISTHILTPADKVYVLKTAEGNYVKMRFDGYYDAAGTSGYPSFSWASVSEPENLDTGDTGEIEDTGDTGGVGEDDSSVNCSSQSDLALTAASSIDNTTEVNSGNSSAWACFSFESAESVETDWQLAWKQWTAAMPMGSAGIVIEGGDFDAIDQAPADGWSFENMSLFGDWYNYDGSTHVLTAKDRVYLLMDPDSRYWKLQLTSYYGSDGQTLHRPTFRWAPISPP